MASPELLVEHEGFQALYTNQKFTLKPINITFNEAHCIVLWSSDEQCLLVLKKNIKHTFLVKDDAVEEIHMSNDCPNIHMQIVQMKYGKMSQKNL